MNGQRGQPARSAIHVRRRKQSDYFTGTFASLAAADRWTLAALRGLFGLGESFGDSALANGARYFQLPISTKGAQ